MEYKSDQPGQQDKETSSLASGNTYLEMLFNQIFTHGEETGKHGEDKTRDSPNSFVLSKTRRQCQVRQQQHSWLVHHSSNKMEITKKKSHEPKSQMDSYFHLKFSD